MKINRSQLVADLFTFATTGNGVVIGPPGVGKSYALGELRQKLKASGLVNLVLSVERLGAATEADVRRVLGREGDLIAELRASVEGVASPSILIFDGFDAARGETERAGVLKLIERAVQELRGQWQVLVSVRTFDARKSQRLLELFPAADAKRCRKFEISPLTESEVGQAFDQVGGLRSLYENGSAEFRTLLTIPFNLWLIGQVLLTATSVPELSRVTSEVQLLELYWKYRVRTGANEENREFILREATRQMVERHTLTIRRASIYQPAVQAAWGTLLSDEILAEVQEAETGVAFTHNILFDFAVSIYLLDASPEKFAAFVAEEPARPLFLRPSLVYHFTRLWHFGREAFWTNFWSVVAQEQASLRQIIRIVLPAVVIQEARLVSDLTPLNDRLAAGETRAMEAVAFALQALRVLQTPRTALWSSFLRAVARHPDRRFAWDACFIATSFLPKGTGEIVQDCGEVGRRFLEWAWGLRKDQTNGDWYERFAGILTVPLVAQTYATEPAESRRLLLAVLAVVGEPDFPIDCIYRLAHEIKSIMREDPDFVGQVYERVFGYAEKSDTKTNFGGTVLPLISNRRQDFESCRYGLIQEYPHFLELAPLPAIVAGLRAVQSHAIQAHVGHWLREGKTLQDLTQEFAFRGHTARHLEDGSAIWDETSFPDQEMALARSIFQWLEATATAHRELDVDKFLTVFATEAQAAFLWARLLETAAEHPTELASRVWELAKARPVLEGNDTLVSLGALLERGFGQMASAERAQIEHAIMGLPADGEGKRREWLERRRVRLLARIPAAVLVTPEAQALRQQLAETQDLPGNAPLYSFTSSSRPYSEDESLRDHGVDLNDQKNSAVRDLYAPLIRWEDQKKVPEKIDELLPAAAALDSSLANPEGIDPAVVTLATAHLARFGSEALRRTDESGTPRFELLRKLVLSAAANPEPQPNPSYDDNWTYPAWSQAPRNEAAQALPWLVHLIHDAEALQAIRNLATDPVPSVRFLLANEIWRMHERYPADMWELLDAFAKGEKNKTVLHGLSVSLWRLTELAPERTRQLVQRLLGQTPDDGNDSDDNAIAPLVSIVIAYAVDLREPWAQATTKIWRENPVQFAGSLAISGRQLIEFLKPGEDRTRADLARTELVAHLDSAAKGLTELQKDVKIPRETVQKKWRALYGIIDNAVMRIYFAADIDPQLRQRTEKPLTEEERREFFVASLPILRKVLSFGLRPETGMLLAPTAHYFMQLLNGVLKYDPPLVLGLAAEVVQSSKRFGYNLDSIAMKETVALVETLLADFRSEIQGEESVKQLLGLLDAFVEAGWPEALNLVWRLDEIYR